MEVSGHFHTPAASLPPLGVRTPDTCSMESWVGPRAVAERRISLPHLCPNQAPVVQPVNILNLKCCLGLGGGASSLPSPTSHVLVPDPVIPGRCRTDGWSLITNHCSSNISGPLLCCIVQLANGNLDVLPPDCDVMPKRTVVCLNLLSSGN
jgi:hypothetical protein